MLEQEIIIGRFCLRLHRELLLVGKVIALGSKPLSVLSVLAEANGQLVTKDELMAAVWPRVFVEDNALQVHVVALRRALAHEAGRLITVRGQGYRLDLRSADHSDSAGALSAAPPRYAIAVLPFVNFTPFPDMEYFADGLTDELICLLSRLPDIYVPAMHSVFAYKGRHEDIRRIADALGVAYALEGGVRLASDRLRLTAQLIDAQSGFHVWAQSYDRPIGNQLLLQAELANAIGEALALHLAQTPI